MNRLPGPAPRLFALLLLCLPGAMSTAHAAPRTRPLGAQASFSPTRPGPRAKAPTVVFSGLDSHAARLFHVDGQWHLFTDDGRLLRLSNDGAATPVFSGIPKTMRLFVVDKTWYGTTSQGIWRLDADGMKNVVYGKEVYGVQAIEGHFWWSSSNLGGSIYRQPIGATDSEVMAQQLGPADTFLPRTDDILVAMRGAVPRGIKRFDKATGEVASLFASRLFGRRLLVADGRTLMHMDDGAGFIKELISDKPGGKASETFKRLVISPGGSRALHVVGKSLVWCANSGVYRLDLVSGMSAALALNTNPRDLVVLNGEAVWIDGWRRQLLKAGL